MQIQIFRYDTIDSTNSEAMRQAKLGAEEGLCIIADEQTAGRGRHGRTWISEKDSGLYLSILLRPTLPTELTPLITLMSAVSVHQALAKSGVAADIKWVNDLLVGDKKICGILAEATATPNGLAVVVGIGINLRDGNFPSELAATATSIEALTGTSPDRDLLAGNLVDAIRANYKILQSPQGPAEIRRMWTERSSYADGKSVTVRTDGEVFAGITRGIEENGALRVETAEGAVKIVQAGDVERLRSTQ